MTKPAKNIDHPHIVSEKDLCGGSPVIRGTKFPVRSVVNYVLRQGISPEECPLLGEILRQRGRDVVHVIEVDRAGKTDADQLAYAASQQRAFLTHNIRDFRQLNKQYHEETKNTSVFCFPTKFHLETCSDEPFGF